MAREVVESLQLMQYSAEGVAVGTVLVASVGACVLAYLTLCRRVRPAAGSHGTAEDDSEALLAMVRREPPARARPAPCTCLRSHDQLISRRCCPPPSRAHTPGRVSRPALSAVLHA